MLPFAPDPLNAAVVEAVSLDAQALRARVTLLLGAPADPVAAHAVKRLLSGEVALEDVLDTLLACPGRAVAELLRAFPGPILQDAFAHDAPPWTPADLSLVAKAIGRLGAGAVALAVAAGERHKDRSGRLIAVLLADRTCAPGVAALCGHRLGDPEPRVAYAAAEVLGRMRQREPELAAAARRVLAILQVCMRAGDEQQQLGAVRAASFIHERSFVEPLIGLLAGPLADQAHQALTQTTGQDAGRSERAWQRWFERHGESTRVEWLMDALGGADAARARAALRSLQLLTGQRMTFDSEAGRSERRECARRWQQWWREGAPAGLLDS